MRTLALSLIVLVSLFACTSKQARLDGKNDPNLWLENIEGDKALQWVKEQNQKTLGQITQGTRYKNLEKQALNILQAKDKIPYVSMRGEYLYNFWQDEKHVRGLWRRTTLSQYRKKTPQWEVVLDLDKLSKKENENWVYKGSQCLPPKFDLCLLSLSRGGKDAVVVREFNVKDKKFVKNGFYLKEAKSWVSWIDRHQVFVSTDFGQGSLTHSGYPRLVKVWRRGTQLAEAKLVREAKKTDMTAYGQSYYEPNSKTALLSTLETFYTSTHALYENGKLWNVPLPKSSKILSVFKNYFIIELRKSWNVDKKSFKKGSLLAVRTAVAKSQTVKQNDVFELFEPGEHASILQVGFTKDSVLVNSLENVSGKIYQIAWSKKSFKQPEVMTFKKNTHVVLADSSPFHQDFFFKTNGFLNPDAFYIYNHSSAKTEKLKSLPAKFDSKGMTVEQRWATSKDGAKVPYFLVGKKEIIKKGKAPTLLYGYGGFEVSLTPTYKPVVGKLWLEKGGLYVMANIRGGGEFGPKWHQAALKTHRQRAYDDFIAVGEDLVKNGTTTTDHLAIQGGSNGGLLVGAVMVQRPDLFKAVLCHVPLLDMMRYSQLLAGASWMGEYGDPKDSKMREYLLTYSPYQNVSATKKYPELFLMTSTKDDRVHPGHARKMAARMMKQGHENIFYYENTEGGHAASANLQQKARMRALSYEFLFRTIQ